MSYGATRQGGNDVGGASRTRPVARGGGGSDAPPQLPIPNILFHPLAWQARIQGAWGGGARPPFIDRIYFYI